MCACACVCVCVRACVRACVCYLCVLGCVRSAGVLGKMRRDNELVIRALDSQSAGLRFNITIWLQG